PHAPMLQQLLLLAVLAAGPLEAEVLVGPTGGDAAAGGAGHEALLDEVGLDPVLEGVALLAEGGGHRLDADGSAVEPLDDDPQVAAVEGVEPEGIDVHVAEG